MAVRLVAPNPPVYDADSGNLCFIRPVSINFEGCHFDKIIMIDKGMAVQRRSPLLNFRFPLYMR